MAQLGKPDDALLFIAFSFRKKIALADLKKKAIKPFGEIFKLSDCFSFEYSNYYEPEMGSELLKVFAVYKDFYPIEKAVQTKLNAIAIENETAENGRRTINIDPGYLTLAKLVLTTTKNFDHRIHIGAGIFADVQIRYRNGEFVANSWTYPDYRERSTFEFLKSARLYLHQLVKKHETHVQSRRG
jgi:hypothetical protein